MDQSKHAGMAGEKGVADTLTQSVPNNVTSEMGLALLDVADVIRPYPAVVAYLQQVKNDDFLDELVKHKGGEEARAAIAAFLDQCGMRCAGEIDITTALVRKTDTLVPLLLSNIQNFAPGESQRRFCYKGGRSVAKEAGLTSACGACQMATKAAETKRMIDLVRNLIGYREYPKYDIVSRYLIYKQALLQEAARLVQAHVLQTGTSIISPARTPREGFCTHPSTESQIIDNAKMSSRHYAKLTPPRVFTSEKSRITGAYNRDNLPTDALAGLPVSAGVIEDLHGVILNMAEANPAGGDILVRALPTQAGHPCLSPSKVSSPEVSGLMTHSAVIAREYGLPERLSAWRNATKLIKDGQRIRVNGADGFVEVLE
ncbi:MAG: hypothetical protein R2911_40930 [Caldilineaceae bacterium]